MSTPHRQTLLVIFAALSLSAPSAAHAQEAAGGGPSPAPPPESIGRGAPPTADGSAGAQGAEEGEGGVFGEGIAGRNRIGQVTAVGRGAPGAAGRSGPSQHTVQRGDTLWDITGRYYRNAYYWPAVWSYNPHITNPHWIYPGDVVYLGPRGGGDGGGGGPSVIPRSGGREVLQNVGYYSEEELDRAGRVLFSPEEKNLLTFTDNAYLHWRHAEVRDQVAVGQRYAVYRQLKPVVDAETDEPLAYKLQLAGVVRVIHTEPERLPTVVVEDALVEIERGDLVLPVAQVALRVAPSAATVEVQGRIMDVFEPITQVGEHQYVLLDRGAVDGVAVGNRFLVFEQRDGLLDLEEDEEAEEARERLEEEEEEMSEEDREARRRQRREWRSVEVRTWPLDEPPNAPDAFWPYDDDDEYGPEPDDEEEEEREQARRERGEDEETSELDDEAYYDPDRYDRDDLPRRLIGQILVLHVGEKYATAIVTESLKEINVNTRVRMLPGL